MKTPIQSLLFRAGISQAKVAAQLGIDAKTASQKLTGQKDFWWREVVVLCDLLGIENPREVFPNGSTLTSSTRKGGEKVDIGTNLRELRERRNMTQQELADILNFNRVQITQYERGTKVIPLPIAIEITKALDCTIEDLTK